MKFWHLLVNFHARLSKSLLLLEALGFLIVIGILDYQTGYEFSFFPFYSIPILLLVFFESTRSAIVVCILSAVAWRWADSASGHVYIHEWYRNWDTIVRLLFFWLVVAAGTGSRRNQDADRARIELLERSQKLEREIITISEREQQRIGRDLHDELGQHLVALRFAADTLRDDLGLQSPHQAAAAGRIAEQLQTLIGKTRNLARGLSPVDQDAGALEYALEQLAKTTSHLSGIFCSFICDGPVEIQNNSEAVHLYRIAQEALNNALKYGHATEIVIVLESTAESISLRIIDDGVGFDPQLVQNQGMGLNIMLYRARTMGGTLTFEPNTPRGVIVTCTLAASSDSV